MNLSSRFRGAVGTTRARFALAGLLCIVAVLRLAFFDSLSRRVDKTFLGLVVAAIAVVVFPWERLSSFKAAGVELSLERPEVSAAIKGLGLDRIEDQELRRQLMRLDREIAELPGSRVLWIDDRPRQLFALRRLLRSLGVETIQVTSSAEADAFLARDNDVDLIVTDIQRNSETDRVSFEWLSATKADQIADASADQLRLRDGTRYVALHEGTNWVVRLREDAKRDPVIGGLPVIFYAAYDWKRLVSFSAPALAASPNTAMSREASDFLPKAISLLAAARSRPIVVDPEKKPT